MKNYLGVPQSHIILALDTPDRKSSVNVLDECYDTIDVIKLNYPLILKEGLGFLSEIKSKYAKPIIADFKVADVPVTNNRIVKITSDAGADAIMVHGFIGADAIQDVQEQAENKLGVIVVTELTHPGGLDYTGKFSNEFAKLANLLNCFGIQAPGTRPERIKELRKIVGNQKTIISCGVGHQGGNFQETINSGADFAIIGRAIYNSENPRQTINRFQSELSVKQKSD